MLLRAQERERAESLMDDRRFIRASQEYSPFGKGGCGAPLRDSDGRCAFPLPARTRDPSPSALCGLVSQSCSLPVTQAGHIRARSFCERAPQQ